MANMSNQHWLCIVGPIDLPEDVKMNSPETKTPRVAVIDAMKELIGGEEEDHDFNIWSQWINDSKKVEDIQEAWFSNTEKESGCVELRRLKKENEELKNSLGIILRKMGPVSVDGLDIREFSRTKGFVEREKDGNLITYYWMEESR